MSDCLIQVLGDTMQEAWLCCNIHGMIPQPTDTFLSTFVLFADAHKEKYKND